MPFAYLGNGRLRVERQARIDLGGNETGHQLDNLDAKVDGQLGDGKKKHDGEREKEAAIQKAMHDNAKPRDGYIARQPSPEYDTVADKNKTRHH
jgi:hypothetical protein